MQPTLIFSQRFQAMKKLKKLAEQADLITDNTGGAQAEQVMKLKQMVKKVEQGKKKQETTYVKAKRGEQTFKF